MSVISTLVDRFKKPKPSQEVTTPLKPGTPVGSAVGGGTLVVSGPRASDTTTAPYTSSPEIVRQQTRTGSGSGGGKIDNTPTQISKEAPLTMSKQDSNNVVINKSNEQIVYSRNKAEMYGQPNFSLAAGGSGFAPLQSVSKPTETLPIRNNNGFINRLGQATKGALTEDDLSYKITEYFSGGLKKQLDKTFLNRTYVYMPERIIEQKGVTSGGQNYTKQISPPLNLSHSQIISGISKPVITAGLYTAPIVNLLFIKSDITTGYSKATNRELSALQRIGGGIQAGGAILGTKGALGVKSSTLKTNAELIMIETTPIIPPAQKIPTFKIDPVSIVRSGEKEVMTFSIVSKGNIESIPGYSYKVVTRSPVQRALSDVYNIGDKIIGGKAVYDFKTTLTKREDILNFLTKRTGFTREYSESIIRKSLPRIEETKVAGISEVTMLPNKKPVIKTVADYTTETKNILGINLGSRETQKITATFEGIEVKDGYVKGITTTNKAFVSKKGLPYSKIKGRGYPESFEQLSFAKLIEEDVKRALGSGSIKKVESFDIYGEVSKTKRLYPVGRKVSESASKLAINKKDFPIDITLDKPYNVIEITKSVKPRLNKIKFTDAMAADFTATLKKIYGPNNIVSASVPKLITKSVKPRLNKVKFTPTSTANEIELNIASKFEGTGQYEKTSGYTLSERLRPVSSRVYIKEDNVSLFSQSPQIKLITLSNESSIQKQPYLNTQRISGGFIVSSNMDRTRLKEKLSEESVQKEALSSVNVQKLNIKIPSIPIFKIPIKSRQPELIKIREPPIRVRFPYHSYSKTSKGTRGFRTFQIINKKRVYLPGIRARGEALRFGEIEALKRVKVATFGITPTQLSVQGSAAFSPSSKLFRPYRISRGKKLQLKDTFIQRLGRRLSTIQEVGELQMLRRNR